MMTNRLMTLFLVAYVAMSAPLVSGEVYKHIDEQGKVTYTDKPGPDDKNSKIVDLPPINEQPAIQVSPPKSKPKPQNPTQYRISILSPTDGTHVHRGQQTLNITVEVTPLVPEGAKIRLLNGKDILAESESTQFTLSELYRGTYSLSAALINPKGKVIARSSARTFYVHRASAIR